LTKLKNVKEENENMDPVDIKILGIPGTLILWLLTIISFSLFINRVTKLIKLLKKAKSENRFDKIKLRIKNFVFYVLGQKRLFEEKSIGLPHFMFFWGFVFYAGSFFWNLLKGLFPFLPFPFADEVYIISLFLELFGAVVLLSIIIAVSRRIFFPPPHLQKSFDATIILSLIAILMLTTIFSQGFKYISGNSSEWSPIGSIVASFLPVTFKTSAPNLIIIMWWLHIITVLSFLAYIPYSKHIHLLASPFNVFFSNTEGAGNLSIREGENTNEGAAKWNEFSWKDLMNSFSCAECGRCDRACPSLNSGYKLSPRSILHSIKENLYKTVLIGKNETNESLIGKEISEDELWQCTTCAACMERCPVLNEHLQLILKMRRHLVNSGAVDQTIQDMLMKMSRYWNSFGQSDRNRPKWTKELGFTIKDARKEEVEYLWLVGDYASFDPRVQDVTRKTAKIFQKAGMDFGILYEGEKNSGNDIRRIGEEGLFEILKEKNIQTMQKAKFKKIITTDPHTFNTLKNEYNLNVALNFPEDKKTDLSKNGKNIVKHYAEVIDEMIINGKLEISKNLNNSITYHDPCYLGRYNGIYEPPRRILRSLGLKLVEMKRNRSKSYCCGAGGGRIWMEDKTKIQERPSENRIREAVALNGISTIAVACPKDIVMFQDAIKTTGNEGKINAKDLSELIWESIELKEKEK
jgi:Fe-S oxidoreductase/nitrate reductase gamma subunit